MGHDNLHEPPSFDPSTECGLCVEEQVLYDADVMGALADIDASLEVFSHELASFKPEE